MCSDHHSGCAVSRTHARPKRASSGDGCTHVNFLPKSTPRGEGVCHVGCPGRSGSIRFLGHAWGHLWTFKENNTLIIHDNGGVVTFWSTAKG